MSATARTWPIWFCVHKLIWKLDDLVTAYGHHWMRLTNRVIPPQGETKRTGNLSIASPSGWDLEWRWSGTPKLGCKRSLGLCRRRADLERLKEKRTTIPKRFPVPFADRKFRTPSSKFEFITHFTPAPGPTNGGLHLMATKTRRMVNSQILPEDLPGNLWPGKSGLSL